ncbi:DNA-binding GntR family transcriptional regulator [Hoeflea marina]|uniref:DNA-binding GntR family transcriptional regulator n=1 Tax=Hoeflea marina TaxID=274592 RepID=A0A317PQW3_9HYPH|nr:GntR family transcriptional regulator [Hoeflea marina]PWW03852.1 DNA-binding GntR family transcriptional regulator [Hoeflea marina]
MALIDQPQDQQGAFSLPPGRALEICRQLEMAILEHRILPGMKLNEDEVGETFGASRTVARSALQALAHSGLVTIERNRGAFVSRPSIREAHDVFEARALIEPRIARMAARAMSDDDLTMLRAHIENEHSAVHSGNKGQALSLSGAFHLAIAEVANQQVLTQIMRPLISRSSLIIALYWRRPDTTCESHSHEALMKAFAARDPFAAEEVMKSHIVDLHSGLDLVERPAAEPTLAAVFSGDPGSKT